MLQLLHVPIKLFWDEQEWKVGWASRMQKRAKPWHKASVQPPSVLVWVHEINCLSSGCVHGGVGECQLVTVVFDFFSGLSEVNIFGMKQLKIGKTKCHTYCPQPSVLLQAGARYQIWWEKTALLFYTPRCYTVFSSSSKVFGNNWRSSRLWASQTHLSAILRHLAFRPVDMVLFIQYKETNIWGYIYEKKQVTHKWEYPHFVIRGG